MDTECDWQAILKQERSAIDDIDLRIVQLLNERASHAKTIGQCKIRGDLECYAPAREQQVLDRVIAANTGPLSTEALQVIYRDIMSACRSLERRLRVAYLGPAASYAHLACQKHFGSLVLLEPMLSVWEVFNQVDRRDVDYGVVPIENSTEGIVSHALDTFVETNLKICAEIHLPIHHCLLSRFPMEKIARVFSHPQGIAQCQAWLRRHLPRAVTEAVSSTSHGAELARTEPNSAAIANRLAAEVYELEVLHENIEDNPSNRTRFLVIGNQDNPPTGKDKTSIVLSVPHKPGALHRVLGHLEKYSINMTMIQSRPTRVMPWQYLFFIDFQGHKDDQPVRLALDGLKRDCPFVKVLGSYPEAE